MAELETSSPKESPKTELMNLAGTANLLYIKSLLYKTPLHKQKDENVVFSLREKVLLKIGTKTVGEVEGRPDDDEIEIDRVGEENFKSIVYSGRYPIRVTSEHSEYGPLIGFKIRVSQDPLDNSSQYKRGLPTPVFSCLSEYDLEGNPLGGVTVNIREGKVYLSINGLNYVIDNFQKGTTPRLIKKSERTTVKDPEITIASYTGSPEYAMQFYSSFNEEDGSLDVNFGKMIKDMERKGRTYADGGAFIYALLAEGVVDAYVMRNEPISEIAPGAALAITAGCTLWCVNEKGEIEDYKFDHSKFREDVFLFIAASTPELAKEIYDYYFEYHGTALAA